MTSPSVPSSSAVAVEAIADDLNELALQPRRHWLRKRAPRSPYVVDLRKKIAAGLAKPFHMLLALAFSDLDDGAPITVVVQPFEAIIAILREHKARIAGRVSGLSFQKRLSGIMARETRAQGKVDLHQLAVAENPSDLESRVNLRAALREYRVVLDDLDALLDEGYASEQCDRMTA